MVLIVKPYFIKQASKQYVLLSKQVSKQTYIVMVLIVKPYFKAYGFDLLNHIL